MAPMYDFSGRVAVVTGAATGLGHAIAARLATEGASVVLVDIDEAGLETKRAELTAAGLTVHTTIADVSSAAAVESAILDAEATFGPIDTLVNNAGIAALKPYLEHSDDDFDRQIAVNLRGTHLFMSRVLPGMVERQKGYIVNIASIAALHFTTAHAGYAASKAGVIALSRDVAFEVARHGIRVNCVAPGLIAVPPSSTKTPLLQTESTAAGIDLETRTSTRPLGYGRPDDIADAVAFLVSDQARFVIGTTMRVAGGTDIQVSMAMKGT